MRGPSSLFSKLPAPQVLLSVPPFAEDIAHDRTAEELRGIEERERKATEPRFWQLLDNTICNCNDGFEIAHFKCGPMVSLKDAISNAAFAFYARSDIPALLAHIKELTRERDGYMKSAELHYKIRCDQEQNSSNLADHLAAAEAQVKELTKALEEAHTIMLATRIFLP